MGTATNSVGPEVWPKTAIADFPGRAMFTTFGVLNDDASEERAVVSSTHVRDGRIDASDGTAHPDGGRPSRATLREGDLVVVLVRRAGDAALVTAQHAGWTATRSVGIIRAAPHIVRWLQIWLQTPTAKAWIDAEVTAHVEPTLSLDSLRRMPFPLPPTGTITKFHSAISLIEEKIALNRTTAVATLQLADAMHAEWSSDSATWESRPLGEVTMAKSGKGSAKSLVLRSGTPGIDGITPTDLFELSVPYVERSRLCTPGIPQECAPGHTPAGHSSGWCAHRTDTSNCGAHQRRPGGTPAGHPGRMVATARTEEPEQHHRGSRAGPERARNLCGRLLAPARHMA